MKIRFRILLLIAILALAARPAWAQTPAEPGLALRLSRTIGYSSGSGDIQGNFKLRASGPDDLVKVSFYLDDQLMRDVTQAPFELAFVTDGYPLGVHRLSAVGVTAGGVELRSNTINARFVTAAEGWQTAGKIAIPLFGIIFLLIALSYGVPMILQRGKLAVLAPGTPRNYGMSGGAICPRCQRPFAMRLLALNISLVGRFDRCPYCGKWSVLRPRPLVELRQAEAAELENAGSGPAQPGLSEEERLRKELDDSRYRDA